MHSKALLTYAGQLYTAYTQSVASEDYDAKLIPRWDQFVCDPMNKRRVEGWIDVARVAIKIETEVRDEAL